MQHNSDQYWETFPLPNGGWRKLVVETLLEPGDTVRDAFYAGQKEVRQYHYESKGHDDKIAVESKEPETAQSTEAKIIAQIYGCTDLKVLESFKLLSNNYKSVKAAYEQQLNKLNGLQQS